MSRIVVIIVIVIAIVVLIILMAIVIVAVVIVIAIIVVVFASLTLFRWCALSLTDRQVLSRVAAAWTRPVCGKSLAVLPKPRVSDHAKIAIEIGVHARRGNKWNQKREARSSNNRALPIHHHHRPEHLRVSRWQRKMTMMMTMMMIATCDLLGRLYDISRFYPNGAEPTE